VWHARAACEAQHVRLGVLRPDQILELTVATAHADNIEPAEAQWHTELALWTGSARVAGGAGAVAAAVRWARWAVAGAVGAVEGATGACGCGARRAANLDD
jgi:hypothetical protein